MLGYLKERVKKKSQSWEGKIISKGGKETLIKSVLQTLPSYAMYVFLLSLKITRDIERSLTKFWWSKRMDQKFPGCVGIVWPSTRTLGDSDLEILGISSLLCYESKAGDS